MSIDINWATLTSGPDGEALAETIRSFVHERFQQVHLPRMIRSVHVHTFSFGSVPPSIELRDVCDPLRDFYDSDSSASNSDNEDEKDPSPPSIRAPMPTRDIPQGPRPLRQLDIPPRSPTPRLGTNMSALGYFHLPLSAGLSGTSTPLAAVAGAARFPLQQHQPRSASPSSSPASSRPTSRHNEWAPSSSAPSSRPSSRHNEWRPDDDELPDPHQDQRREKRDPTSPQDLQVVARVTYDGDVRLSLTAEILLDYPTAGFVGIPLQLHVTGLRFDGTVLLALIRKKAHLCFLSEEDAALYAPSSAQDGEGDGATRGPGGLIEEIRVESEIGKREDGKQVLKNVGKVERFVLEQVRRIFEEEFVYPSFWTFLV